MREKTWTVYIHRQKNSGKVYVGTTSQPLNNRFRKNGEGYRTGYGTQTPFYKAILEHGWDSFEHIVVKTGLDERTAKDMEIAIIEELDAHNPEHGYNATLGGDGVYGLRVSEKERQRRREYMTGRTVSAETRQKQSIARKGRTTHNKGVYRPSMVQYDEETNTYKRIKTCDGVFDTVGECAAYYGAARQTVVDWFSKKRVPNGKYANVNPQLI